MPVGVPQIHCLAEVSVSDDNDRGRAIPHLQHKNASMAVCRWGLSRFIGFPRSETVMTMTTVAPYHTCSPIHAHAFMSMPSTSLCTFKIKCNPCPYSRKVSEVHGQIHLEE